MGKTNHIVFGFSGRAQAGKDTMAEYIKREIRHDTTGLFDDFDDSYGSISIEILHFADTLKEICADLFNLSEYQLNDAKGKDELTHIKWENMPGVITQSEAEKIFWHYDFASRGRMKPLDKDSGFLGHRLISEGRMTGREVLEFFGTDVARSIDPECWINSLKNRVNEAISPTIFLIADVRSSNEVDIIHEMGGYVQRLMRDPQKRTTTIESQLDSDNYDWNKFDSVLDNRNMTLSAKSVAGSKEFARLMDIHFNKTTTK